MPIKVFLDDERAAPESWVQARWPDEAIRLLQSGGVTHLSLDHDLGDDERGTGYDVLLWIEREVALIGHRRFVTTKGGFVDIKPGNRVGQLARFQRPGADGLDEVSVFRELPGSFSLRRAGGNKADQLLVLFLDQP